MAGAAASGASRIPLVGGALESLTRTAVGPTTARRSGPDEEERGRSRTLCVAETFDADGTLQHRVRVEGPSPYDLTASLLAWGARMMWQGSTHGTGALGPAEAMGSEALIGGCLALGLAEVR